MKKETYKLHTRALRDVLSRLGTSHALPIKSLHFEVQRTSYKRSGYLYLYNAKARNVIATIKVGDGELFVRYRANSVYANILKDPETWTKRMPDKVVVTVPSLALRSLGHEAGNRYMGDTELRSREPERQNPASREFPNISIDDYIDYMDTPDSVVSVASRFRAARGGFTQYTGPSFWGTASISIESEELDPNVGS